MNLISLLISSILIENVILTRFLGLCPFLGISNKEDGAISMGISITIVMVIASIITYILHNYILVPLDIEYLRTILFILIIASLVQLLEMFIRKYFPKTHEMFGIYLPLITTNCAILGVVLLSRNYNYTFIETLIFAIGSSIGYMLVLYIFSNIRIRLEESPIPEGFKGIPIALVCASIMSLLFIRYVGF